MNATPLDALLRGSQYEMEGGGCVHIQGGRFVGSRLQYWHAAARLQKGCTSATLTQNKRAIRGK